MNKKLILTSFLIACFLMNAYPSVGVRGHVTKKGTYIARHHRTSPDHSKHNNWSSKGNRNPYTGKKGHQK